LNTVPLQIASLPTNITNSRPSENFCQVVGWGNFREISPHRVVAVFGSSFCNPNLPQLFCSTIDSGSEVTCSAMQGSPVICGYGTEVAGIVISPGTCTGEIGNRRLDYHSVGEFKEWIQEVSGAESVGKVSMTITVFSAITGLLNFF
jgi:hypothetical protein